MDAKYFPDWEKMTVREIRAYLRERQSVILPIGVIEQHGYHLPTCTDAVSARETSRRVGEKIGMLVAPTFTASFSGGELPGTINVNPNVMGIVLGEVLQSLAAQGLRNIFMVLGHAGSENFRALEDTARLLLRTNPLFQEVMLVFAPLWKFAKHWAEGFHGGDWHAGWVETSMIMELAPELVQMDFMEKDEKQFFDQMIAHPDNYQAAFKPIEDDTVIPRMVQDELMQVGVMGFPEKASPEIGREIVEEMVEHLSEHFTRLERERSREYKGVSFEPEPIVLL